MNIQQTLKEHFPNVRLKSNGELWTTYRNLQAWRFNPTRYSSTAHKQAVKIAVIRQSNNTLVLTDIRPFSDIIIKTNKALIRALRWYRRASNFSVSW